MGVVSERGPPDMCGKYSGTPLNECPSTVDTHDIMDNSESPDRFSIDQKPLNSRHPATSYNAQESIPLKNPAQRIFQPHPLNNCTVEPLMPDPLNTDIAIIWTNVQGPKHMPMHTCTNQLLRQYGCFDISYLNPLMPIRMHLCMVFNSIYCWPQISDCGDLVVCGDERTK